MDIYILLFMIIIFLGSIISYIYYLKDKANQFGIVSRGVCPFCKNKSIELIDTRGGGCTPKLLTFKCTQCNYENSFNIPSNCGI
ncbi:hypothetical protein MNB_SV-15-1206 [hydrothermal vent metagenome]|uniref:Uncharacterized protein n=1 Tax=hydrothermal vent metagenome TaxID=652676 RepID=A0A1W1ELB2_9ZZZZ